MLRLTFLLCSGLFLVMLLGGRDFGQLRPGLTLAAVEAKAVPVTAAVPAVETADLVPAVAVPVVTEQVGVAYGGTAPVIVAAAPVVIAPPAPAEQPAENTVFTLATFADDSVAAAAPEQSAEGEIWYVAGKSLNVRSGPSTDDAVVGKLTRGEAMLVVAREGDEWARIKIEGDGIEGYVATRFLTPTVPVIN